MGLLPSHISLRLIHVPALMTGLPSVPPAGGQLVQLCGSIIRMSTKRVVPYASRLMCPRCRTSVEVFTAPFDRAAEAKATCEQPSCKKEPMQVVGQVWMDYAECRLQQRSNQSGRLPRSVLVTLDDELSTKCSVGQFVEVVGLIFPKWRHTYPTSRPTIEPAIWAINVLPMEAYRGVAMSSTSSGAPRRRAGRADRPKFTPEQFFASFCKDRRRREVALVRSVCPQLFGLFAPRVAMLLCTLGGASTAGKTSMHIRSTIHCLLVGDPSTGKTQLLRFAAAIAPRSTSTTGMGSTSAGLTVAAAKEHGEWVLEPGALVLSDGGSCIIDELRTVSPADRASLHEAMEQQTISVAKGGLVTKLRTACSVLSACNPPVRRDGRIEIGVGGPLLSRFDFIFLLWDTPQPEVDASIASHMLQSSTSKTMLREEDLTVEEVARYLWWVRTQYAAVDGPLLTDSAAELLGRYYEIHRQRGASPSLDDAVPVTVRFLESLVRLAQAHAKLHLQMVCTLEDAAMAVFLMERTAYSLKCPLKVLGDDLYSSSRELDDVFLSDTPEAIQQQEAVLAALVDVIRYYQLPSDCERASYADDHPTYADSGGGPNKTVEEEGRVKSVAELPFLRAMRLHTQGRCNLDADDLGGEAEDGALLTQRNTSSAALQAATLAAISSATRLAEEVHKASCSPVTVYPYSSDLHPPSTSTPFSAAALLASQRAPSSSPSSSLLPRPLPPSHHKSGPIQFSYPAAHNDENAAEDVLLIDSCTSSPLPSSSVAPTQPSQQQTSSVTPSQVLPPPPTPSLQVNRKRSAEDIMNSLRCTF